MKYLKIFFLNLTLLCLPGVFVADAQVKLSKDPAARKVLDAMQKEMKSHSHLRLKVSYLLINKQNDSKKQFKAYIFLSGDKYKIIVPENEIICNGDTVWTYSKKTQELTISKNDTSDVSVFTPSQLFSAYRTGYKYLLIGEEKIKGAVFQVVDLFPELKSKSPYSKIRLKINKQIHRLQRAEITEKSGLEYQVDIVDFQPHTKIPDKLFHFNPALYPPDIEIVDMM